MAKGKETQMSAGQMIAAGVIIAVIIMVGLFAVAAELWHNQTSTQQQTTKGSSVTVYADGYTYAKPTEAIVDLFINATGNTSKNATENLSVELSALNKTLYTYVDGNTSLIQTSYFNVYKGYRPGQPIPTTSGPVVVPSTTTINYSNVSYYTAQEYVQVTLPQLSRLNGMLFNISDISSVQVQSVEATIAPSQLPALKQKAIAAALANATEQASVIIGNGTVTSRNVTIENYYAIPYVLNAASGSAASGSPGSVASQLGPIFYNGTSTVSASVSAVFYYNTK